MGVGAVGGVGGCILVILCLSSVFFGIVFVPNCAQPRQCAWARKEEGWAKAPQSGEYSWQ